MRCLLAQRVSQSSSLRPGMFWKSAVLWVTSVVSRRKLIQGPLVEFLACDPDRFLLEFDHLPPSTNPPTSPRPLVWSRAAIRAVVPEVSWVIYATRFPHRMDLVGVKP